MKRYRVLCLTDHAQHSKENSLYALVSSMAQHGRCQEVAIASRSNKANNSFFYDSQFANLFVSQADEHFTYTSARGNLHSMDHEVSTRDYDIIFLRLPRPTPDEFFLKLEAFIDDKCIINRPSGIVLCGNKSVLLNFQSVCPPIRLCHSIEQILDFSKDHDLVLKPLKEYGGKGLLRLTGSVLNDGKNNYSAIEYLTNISSSISDEGFLAMKYLKNVNQGDKRLIVVGGTVLAASLRLPPDNSWLCNVAMGGTSVYSTPDTKELAIIETINPYLQANGILIYGADTLVDDDGNRTLSEINALSIGGFPQAQRQTGKPIINMTIDQIIKYADQYYST